MPYSRFSRKRVARRRAPARRRTFGARIRRGITRRVGVYGRYNKLSRYQGGRKAPEMKIFDIPNVAVATAALSSNAGGLITATIDTFAGTGIAQGAGIFQRLGNRISLRRLQVHAWFVMTPASAAITIGNMSCFYLIMDTQANGAIPVTAGNPLNVLGYINNTTGLVTGAFDTFQFPNPVNKGRFRILKRKYLKSTQFANVAATNVCENQHFIRWDVPCNIPIEYDATNVAGSTGVIGTVKVNNVFWLFVNGDNATWAGKVSSRVLFTDY